MGDLKKNPTINRNSIIAVAVISGGIFLILVICLGIIIGPGLPPNHNFAATMVSSQSMMFQNCSAAEKNPEMHPEFCVEQVFLEYYPPFRELTPMASYVVFRNMNTSGQRVAAFWNFNSKDDFDTARGQLRKYLQDHGRVSVATLALDNEKLAIRNIHPEYPEKKINSIPQQITGSSFIGKDTAGYFFVINQPVSKSREDFFIEYVGLVGDTNLTAGSTDLEYLIAMQGDSYYLFNEGTVPL
jgi:hypothetical protein